MSDTVGGASGDGQNWIRTDLNGFITQISSDAALMIGVAQKFAAGRRLPSFFNGDRPGVYRDMRAAYDTRCPITRQHILKPLEHRAISVEFWLQYVAETHELLWMFIRTETELVL
jgi:hypothetical protein